MVKRGNTNRGSLDLAVRGNHLLDRSKWSAVKLVGHLLGPIQISVNHAHQAHRLTILGQFAINTSMITPEGADSNYGDRNEIFPFQVALY